MKGQASLVRAFAIRSHNIGNERQLRGELWLVTDETPHDKINKMTMRPAKTLIGLGICPV